MEQSTNRDENMDSWLRGCSINPSPMSASSASPAPAAVDVDATGRTADAAGLEDAAMGLPEDWAEEVEAMHAAGGAVVGCEERKE